MADTITKKTIEDILKMMSVVERAPGDRRVPLLRSYLEQSLDEFELLEIEVQDFIADCALLAAQRMQDLRLEVVEIRLSNLEKPTFNMRDIVLDLVLLVTIELAVILAPHALAGSGAAAGIGGLISTLFSNRARARAIRAEKDLGLSLIHI